MDSVQIYIPTTYAYIHARTYAHRQSDNNNTYLTDHQILNYISEGQWLRYAVPNRRLKARGTAVG
jgi:hypothetical protein